jgi:hypothetical protein
MSRSYRHKTTRVPVEPLQEAFKESGLTLSEVCFRIGWTVRRDRHGCAGDTARLSRALGLQPQTSSISRGTRYINRRVRYETAVRIAEALDLDPDIVETWVEPPEPEPEPAGPAADGRCPECGTTATWTDSWDQQRCDQCGAIVATAEAEPRARRQHDRRIPHQRPRACRSAA